MITQAWVRSPRAAGLMLLVCLAQGCSHLRLDRGRICSTLTQVAFGRPLKILLRAHSHGYWPQSLISCWLKITFHCNVCFSLRQLTKGQRGEGKRGGEKEKEGEGKESVGKDGGKAERVDEGGESRREDVRE